MAAECGLGVAVRTPALGGLARRLQHPRPTPRTPDLQPAVCGCADPYGQRVLGDGPQRAAAARALLAGLVTAPRLDGRDFCRSAFGPDQWLDLDRNGCSARQDILVRQAVQLRVGYIRSHGSTCKEALSGTWVDAYTGARITIANLKDGAQAATLQIDHIVSLYEAWVSGAKRWTPAQRLVFAQDVAAPELWAVAGSVNFGKAYRGADSWTPPAPALRCRFATAYVVVKVKYDLTVTAAERASLSTMLATCRA